MQVYRSFYKRVRGLSERDMMYYNYYVLIVWSNRSKSLTKTIRFVKNKFNRIDFTLVENNNMAKLADHEKGVCIYTGNRMCELQDDEAVSLAPFTHLEQDLLRRTIRQWRVRVSQPWTA